jgi:hypothetical protein
MEKILTVQQAVVDIKIDKFRTSGEHNFQKKINFLKKKSNDSGLAKGRNDLMQGF